MTYELEEIKNIIVDYLSAEEGKKIIAEDPTQFFLGIIGTRITPLQVKRALNFLKEESIIKVKERNNEKVVKLVKFD